jgi:hypothetical protein
MDNRISIAAEIAREEDTPVTAVSSIAAQIKAEEDRQRQIDGKLAEDQNTRISPELQAKALPLAKAAGLPIDTARRNIDQLQADAAKPALDKAKVIAPSYAAMLQTADHGPIAQSAVSEMPWFERVMRSYGQALTGGFEDLESSDIGYRRMQGTATPQDLERLKELKQAGKARTDFRLDPVTSFFQYPVASAPATATTFARTWDEVLLGAGTGAAAAGTAGLVTGPGAGAAAVGGAVTGAGIGLRVGLVKEGYEQLAGDAYNEALSVLDAEGNPLDENAAYTIATFAGGVGAVAELLPFEKALDTMPFLKGVVGKEGARTLAKLAADNPAARASLARIGRVLKVGGAEAFTEVLQEATQLESIIAAGGVTDEDGNVLADQRLDRYGQAAVGGFAGGTTLGAAGETITAGVEKVQSVRQQRAEAKKTALVELGDKIRSSKVGAMSPETIVAHARQIDADGGGPQMSAPAEAVLSLFQAEGLTAEQIQAEFPTIAQALDEATQTGADVPLNAEAITKLARLEGFTGLADDIRTAPGELTAREAREQGTELDTLVADVSEEDKRMAVRASIESQYTQQLVAAGTEPRAAATMAKVHSSFITTMAERTGMDADALMKRFPLQITGDQQTDMTAVDPNTTMFQGQKGVRVFRGSPEAETAPQARDFAGVFTSTDRKSAEQYGQVQEYVLPEGTQLLDMNEVGNPTSNAAGMVRAYLVGKGEAIPDDPEEFSRIASELHSGLAGDIDFDTEDWPDFVKSLGFQGTKDGPDVLVYDPALLQPATGNRGTFLFQGSKQTETLEFRTFFDGSKVVDEAGAPLVVYHGTDQSFDTFGRTEDIGYHFGAESAAKARVGGLPNARIMPVYLNIRNPLRVKDHTDWDIGNVLQEFVSQGLIDQGAAEKLVDSDFVMTREWVRDTLASNGYDGMVYRNDVEGGGDSYIVFEPTQIKSATGNRGTFDPSNPNILYQGDPVPTPEQELDESIDDLDEAVEDEGYVGARVDQVDALVDDKDIPVITLQDLVGKKIFPTIADRTAAAALYRGIDGSQLDIAIPLLGGPYFPLRVTNWLANIVWANRGKGVTSQKAARLKEGANYMLVVMGDANMHQSNTTVSRAFFGTLQAYARDGRVKPEGLKALGKMIAAKAEETQPVVTLKSEKARAKAAERTEPLVYRGQVLDNTQGVNPKLAKKKADLEAFPGFEDAAKLDAYLDGISFEARKEMLRIMGTKEAKAFGVPSMEKILAATIQPQLAGHRWGDGMLLVELDQESLQVDLGTQGTMPHPDFPLGIRGKVIGKLNTPINYETLWGDWLNNTYQEKLAENVAANTPDKPINVRRAFELSKPIVEVTQKLADRIGNLAPGNIESHRQARLAADFAMNNWRVSGKDLSAGGVSVQGFIDALAASEASATLSPPEGGFEGKGGVLYPADEIETRDAIYEVTETVYAAVNKETGKRMSAGVEIKLVDGRPRAFKKGEDITEQVDITGSDKVLKDAVVTKVRGKITVTRNGENVTKQVTAREVEKGNFTFVKGTNARVKTLTPAQLIDRQVKDGSLLIKQLGDGEIYYALKEGSDYEFAGVPALPGDKTLTSVVNNELGAGGIAGPAVLLDAIANGATVLDCFAVKSASFPDGFLPALYSVFGFEVAGRVPFNPEFFSGNLADAEAFWTKYRWNKDDGYPDVVVMRWKGTDADRKGILERYLRSGLEGLLAGGADPDARASSAEFNAPDQQEAQEGRPAADAGRTAGDPGAGRATSVASRAQSIVRDIGNLTDAEARNLGLDPKDRDKVATLLAETQKAPSPGPSSSEGMTTLYQSDLSFYDPSLKPLIKARDVKAAAIRTVDQLVQIADGMKSWRDWYDRYEQVLIDFLGSPEEAQLFQDILSATSQAASVKANVGLAIRAYDSMKSGQPFTGFLPAVIGNLNRIRENQAVQGRKIGQYGEASNGNADAIAVDRHIAMVIFGVKAPSPKQIEQAKAMIREVASQLGWDPREVQAALWAGNQILLGTPEENIGSYDAVLLKKGEPLKQLFRDIQSRNRDLRGEGGSPSPVGAVAGGAEGQQAPQGTQRLDQSTPVGTPLTESQFRRKYLMHIDLRGRRANTALSTREKILAEGWKSGGSVNTLPIWRDNANIMSQRFKPLAGDVVYLVPEKDVRETGNGGAIKDGHRFAPWEVLTIQQDGEDIYEAYRRAFNQASSVRAPETGPSSLEGTLNQRAQSTQSFARGSIAIAPGRANFQITLTGRADLSTFMHEAGHYYLEVIQGLVESGDANRQMVEDLSILRAWMGLEPGNKMGPPTRLDRKQHEQFARGWEAYLMEGRAPSAELQSVFNRFRAWLVFIYKKLSGLNVELTDDVRSVMDRLIASDAEIAEARTNVGWSKPLPKEALYLTDDEYDRYVEAWDKANEAQQREVDASLMLEAARETQKAWKEERRQVFEEEKAKLAQTRGYKAWKLLSTGEGLNDVAPGRTTIKIDPATVPAEWSRDAAGMTEDGGLPLDFAAEFLGFASGEGMLSLIAGAKFAERELPRQVKQIMAERHGDLDMTALADIANDAVHSDKTQEVLLTEYRAMAARAGIPAAPAGMTKWMSAQAQQKIMGLTKRQLDPGRWRRAELAAAQKAAKAKDPAQAAVAKRQQMMAAAMYKASVLAQKRVEVIRNKLTPFTKNDRRVKLGKAGDLYLDGIDQILEDIQLKPMSAQSVQKLDRLQKLVEAADKNGEPLVLPDKLRAMLGKKNFADMTLEELEGVHDTVMNIWHLAKLKNELKARNEKRQLEEALTEMEANAQAALGDPNVTVLFTKGWKDRAASRMRALRAGLTKMEFLFGWLDGKPDGGLMHRLIYQPIADANKAKYDTLKRFNETIIERMRNMPKEQKARWETRRTFMGNPTANGATIISTAMNLGNEGNKQKLLEGYKWNEQQLMAEINAFMTKADWDFVQHVWDEIDTLWPKIEATTKAATGLAPEKVVASPIVTPFGTYAGGYYPVVYDPDQTEQQFKNQQESAGLFTNNYARPTLGDGFTKARVQYAAPIKLELSVISQHLAEVVHYVTHYEAITQADKITRHPRFQAVVKGHMGNEFYRTIRPWLQDVARDQDTPAITNQEPFAKAMRHLRGGVSVAAMGYNVFTGVKQLIGVVQSLDAIGPTYWASGLAKAWLSPNAIANWKFAFKHSQELEPLVTQLDRDIKMVNDAYARQTAMSIPATVFSYAFKHIGWLQAAVNVATWHGAYEQDLARNGGDRDKAVMHADAVVRMTQSAGAVKDLSPIQRGTEINRAVSMFYSWFNVLYNRLEDIARQTKSIRDVPKAAARVAILVMMSSMIEEAGRRAWEAVVDNYEEDEEERGYILSVLLKSADTALGAIPMARVFISAEAATGGFTPDLVPVAGIVDDYWRTMGAAYDWLAEGEVPSRGDVKRAIRTVSVIGGVPLSGPYNFLDELFGEAVFDEGKKTKP